MCSEGLGLPNRPGSNGRPEVRIIDTVMFNRLSAGQNELREVFVSLPIHSAQYFCHSRYTSRSICVTPDTQRAVFVSLPRHSAQYLCHYRDTSAQYLCHSRNTARSICVTTDTQRAVFFITIDTQRAVFVSLPIHSA